MTPWDDTSVAGQLVKRWCEAPVHAHGPTSMLRPWVYGTTSGSSSVLNSSLAAPRLVTTSCWQNTASVNAFCTWTTDQHCSGLLAGDWKLAVNSHTGACCTTTARTWMASLLDPGVADRPSVRNLTFSSRSWKVAKHAPSDCERHQVDGVCSWAMAAMHSSLCLQGPRPC